MKDFRVRFTPEAAQCVSKLHPDQKKIIRKAIDQLRQEPFAGDDLREELAEYKSFKPKKFRIIYSVDQDNQVIQVFYIGLRRDLYDQFRRLLAELKP